MGWIAIRNNRIGSVVAGLDPLRLPYANSETWTANIGTPAGYKYIAYPWEAIVYAEDSRSRDPSNNKTMYTLQREQVPYGTI